MESAIVDEIRAHGSGMAEIAHLDRRWARGEDAGPGIAAMAHEVDRDVDLEVAQALGDGAVARRAHIVKRIEGRHRAGACNGVVASAERDAGETWCGRAARTSRRRGRPWLPG
jgi:hypothetical protein